MQLQGKFRVDLRETDFMVSPGMLWTSVGNHAVHRVDISAVILWRLFTVVCNHAHLYSVFEKMQQHYAFHDQIAKSQPI